MHLIRLSTSLTKRPSWNVEKPTCTNTTVLWEQINSSITTLECKLNAKLTALLSRIDFKLVLYTRFKIHRIQIFLGIYCSEIFKTIKWSISIRLKSYHGLFGLTIAKILAFTSLNHCALKYKTLILAIMTELLSLMTHRLSSLTDITIDLILRRLEMSLK